jgi:hypothetical protein
VKGALSNMSCSSAIVEFDKFIKSLQSKIEWNIEIEMETKCYCGHTGHCECEELMDKPFVQRPKITNNQIKILKTNKHDKSNTNVVIILNTNYSMDIFLFNIFLYAQFLVHTFICSMGNSCCIFNNIN